MSNGLSDGPVYMYPDDPARRLRRRAVAVGAAVIFLVVVFVATRGGGTPPTPAEQATELVRSGQRAYLDAKYAEARKAFEQAQVHNPRNATAHFYLGLIMQSVDNNPGGAEAQYRQAIDAKPTYARALSNLAGLRAKAGSNAEAIDLYRRAVKADDQLADAHLALGLLLRTADPSSYEAVLELQRAVVLDSSLASRIPPDPTTTTSTTAKKKR